MSTVWANVPAAPEAVAALAAAAERPVHAYLLVGPPGAGSEEAAVAFAAAVLCPAGGDGTCEVCRRVLGGLHPDVVHVEREGAFITIGTAREVGRLAARSPVEGDRKVLILHEFHLVRDAGPALLKTIEEPPPSAVFVILAEYVPPELVTIASRCVRVDFAPLSAARVAAALEADGRSPDDASALAEASGGRLDRARLLAADPGFRDRRRTWRSIPERLDGTGATAASLADELVAGLEASVTPLRARHEEERADLDARNARDSRAGGRGGRGGARAGVAELEERQRRELRRQRTDELRAGLAVLAGAYRDRLADPRRAEETLRALERVHATAVALQYNPGEVLLLQGLLARLSQDATGHGEAKSPSR